jgi:energy-coupling factor transporter ATP-binding protein EcfA2
MSRGIERIALRRFRGATTITDLTLDPSKRVVLIFGENGTGKSTLIDAIDLILNRSIGSLEDRSSASEKHLAAIGCSLTDLAVKISCAGNSWTGTYSGRTLRINGAAEPPRTHILRRQRLSRLTEAQPADRYKELRQFIDVAGVESCEEHLKRAASAAEERWNEAVRLKVEAEAGLTKLWKAEGCPGGESAGPLAWAAQKSGADVSSTREKATRLQSLLAALDTAERASEARTAAREEAATCETSLEEIEREIATAASLDRGNDVQLLNLLRQVKGLIAPPDLPDRCPVCRQTVDGATLQQEIDRQIEGLAEMQSLSARREQAARAVERARGNRERTEAEWEAAARKLADEAWALGQWFPEWAASGEEEPGGVPGGRVSHRPEAMAALVALLSEQRAALEALLEGARADAAQYNAISQQYGHIRSTDATIAELEIVHRRLKQALQIVREKRIAFTQTVLGRITDECNRLYAGIHPEEALGLSHFQLDEKRRASVHQGAHFLGHTDVPPQAYFSESHLDTLAFCLFLALAKEYGVRILVLDDVFTSVDQAHLGRTMDLLIHESVHFDQILITTHYRQWRDHYKLRANSGSAIQLVELERWAPERGIRARTEPLEFPG